MSAENSNTRTALSESITLQIGAGSHVVSRSVTGRLEMFASSKTLAFFPDEDPNELAGMYLGPIVITVRADKAPEAHAALLDDEILLDEWTTLREVKMHLVNRGIIELTGKTTQVGLFRVETPIVRVLIS